MLGMNLATLSIPELRRVLDIARARDQADLADSVLAELRARAGATAAGVADAAPAMSFGALEPPRLVAAGVRDGPWWDDEDPDLAPRRRAPIMILGIAAALMLAGGLGWGLTRLGVPGAAAPRPPAIVAPAPVAPAATPKVEAPPAATVEAPAPAVKTPAVEAPVPVTASPAAARPRSRCLTRSTPADRLVCGYPALSRQHDRMVAAYNRALVMSGGDPLALDADQAEWRAARDRVSDRHKLADLYQQRIRALDAIAARPEAEPQPKPKPEQPIF